MWTQSEFGQSVILCHEKDRIGLHKTQKKIEAVVNALQPTNLCRNFVHSWLL